MTALHVMVAVLRDRAGRVLIAQRPDGKVQAGRWEFPGGKLESNEAPEAGLRRELLEELGIVAGPMQRLIEIRHDYPEFSVRLDVREIEHFGGSPRGREGQALKWVSRDALLREDLLEADRPVIQALRLPELCAITPDPARTSRDTFLGSLDATLCAGVKLVQFRAHSLSRREYLLLARDVLSTCRRHEATLLLNGEPALLDEVSADGIHLPARLAAGVRKRPVSANLWLSTACHSRSEIRQAQRIGADFVFISPVGATATHPKHSPIGWAGFAAMARQANMPAFGLGGLSPRDVGRARAAGGRGIAAIGGLWRAAGP